MNVSLKNLFLLALVSLTLVVSGCGSKKKKATKTDDQPVVAASDNQGDDDISLNADSDSGKAGPLQSVYFAFNSATLNGDTKAALDNNAQFLKGKGNVEVSIEGHCDERGGVQYNLALGEKRAKAVRDYLVALGIDSKRMTTISFGKERPVAFGHDEAAWSKNRRANFVITAK